MMSDSSKLTKPLTYQDVYPCPVCRHGEISVLPLMEAFACNFCHHIFTGNLEQQVLKLADSQVSLLWYWNGRNWKGLPREGVEMGWGYLIAGAIFVLLPTTLISFAVYLFPPVPDSPLSWLPTIWIGLTFFSHLICILWLVVEYYQLPLVLYLRAIQRRLLARFSIHSL